MSTALPVVTEWFTVTPVTDTITLVREPHADPLVRANLWHVRGRDRDLLVDCGLGIASFHDALPALVAREPTLVLTHGHFDHMGSAHEFAECWAHGREPVAEPRFGSLEGPALAASDMYPAATHQLLPPLLISARPAADFDPAGYQVRPARVSRALADGDQVDLGDRSFTVLHLPGHSPGSIGLYDQHDGTFFSGDVICDGPLIDDIVGCDIPDYLATMYRLRDLPVRLVHAGHEHDFGQARMHELIDDYIAART